MLSNHLSINLPKASINVTWGIFFWKEMVFTDQPTFLLFVHSLAQRTNQERGTILITNQRCQNGFLFEGTKVSVLYRFAPKSLSN